MTWWYRIRKPPFLSVHTISRHFKNLLPGECFWKHALSLTVFTGYVWAVAVADRGEGPRGPGPPLIYRPNWGPKGWKKIGGPSPPIISGSGWLPPLLIWRSGSTTQLAKQGGKTDLVFKQIRVGVAYERNYIRKYIRKKFIFEVTRAHSKLAIKSVSSNRLSFGQ